MNTFYLQPKQRNRLARMIYISLSVLLLTGQCLHAQEYFRIVNGIPHLPVVASTSAVSSPVSGDMVYSLAKEEAMIYSGSTWYRVCDGASSAATNDGSFVVIDGIPRLPSKASESLASPETGSAYYSTTDKSMKIYDGSQWVALANLPQSSTLSTQTGTKVYSQGRFRFPVLSSDPATTGLSAGAIYINTNDNYFHVFNGSDWFTPCFFISRWNMPGGYEFTFPASTIGDFDAFIHWGDGTTSSITSGSDPDLTHTYSSSGEYIVKISGTFSQLDMLHASDTDKDRLWEIIAWGDAGFTSYKYAFYNCSRLSSIPDGPLPASEATDFSSCFSGCKRLTDIPSNLFDNNPQVTDLSYCFYGCEKLTDIPSGLFNNTTAVTDFSRCFIYCYDLTGIPSGLFDNATAVTDFSSCFYLCTKLTGNAPELWNRTPEPTGNSCFWLCRSLDNYDDIPEAWK